MLRLMTLVSIFSLLVGCTESVKRPKANLDWVNTGTVAGVRQFKVVRYSALEDYDSDGVRLPGATKEEIPFASCDEFAVAMNGRLTADAPAQKELSRYRIEVTKKIKALYEACGSGCWGL